MPVLPPVDVTAVLARLSDPQRWSLRVVETTGSTNADVAAAAKNGAGEFSVVVSEHQRQGRGRFTRQWLDVPGANIAMSVLLRPRREPNAWGWLPLLAGLALGDALRDVGQVQARLKWPNDILVESGEHPGKLCGILAVLEPTVDGPACVLGMGVNVGLGADELPVPTATSLALCGGMTDKSALVAGVLDALAGWYRRWSDGEDLRRAYEANCATIGREVRVQLDAQAATGAVTQGVAVGVDAGGALQVRVGQDLVSVSAGDALHVR